MVTETSATGSHLERTRWMVETLAAVREARAAGIPVVGYTWFPMFTMIEWKYRWSRKGLEHHMLHLGLWDVTAREGRLDRDATPLVDTYRRFATDPRTAVGDWMPTPPPPCPSPRSPDPSAPPPPSSTSPPARASHSQGCAPDFPRRFRARPPPTTRGRPRPAGKFLRPRHTMCSLRHGEPSQSRSHERIFAYLMIFISIISNQSHGRRVG